MPLARETPAAASFSHELEVSAGREWGEARRLWAEARRARVTRPVTAVLKERDNEFIVSMSVLSEYGRGK